MATTPRLPTCGQAPPYPVCHPQRMLTVQMLPKQRTSAAAPVYSWGSSTVACWCAVLCCAVLTAGCEDGTARVWDLRSRQCLRVIQAPNRAPVSGLLLLDAPARLAGHQAASSSGGSKQGPKRLQPLAQLAKYAGKEGVAS